MNYKIKKKNYKYMIRSGLGGKPRLWKHCNFYLQNKTLFPYLFGK